MPSYHHSGHVTFDDPRNESLYRVYEVLWIETDNLMIGSVLQMNIKTEQRLLS